MESINCPGCAKPIRIPAEAMGNRAKCPFCKCHFLGPIRTSDGSLSVPSLIRRNPFAESRTFGPGLALMLVGLLGMLTNAIEVGRAYSDPELFAQQTHARMDDTALADHAEATIRWMPTVRAGFLALSGLVAAGGVAVFRRRGHSLAMLGSVAALFNVGGYCCVLGFPVGGWALFVLMNPEVRASFFKTPTQNQTMK